MLGVARSALLRGQLPQGEHAHRPKADLQSELTNAEMVSELAEKGAICSAEVRRAFEHVDRKEFVPNKAASFVYKDVPIRQGVHHLSAPGIYAGALEALMPLRKGMSFLNIGSGSGYLSCLVSCLTGPTGTSHGIDVHPEMVRFAQERAAELGMPIEFRAGSYKDLDPDLSMRFDRIYVGACAPADATHLYELLEVGGALLAPFAVQERVQQLRRVTRLSETEWHVEVLKHVQFSMLQESKESEAKTPFGLTAPVWTRASHQQFPEDFKRALEAVLLGRSESETSLPVGVWHEHIFPCVPKKWFVPSEALSGVKSICDFRVSSRSRSDTMDARESAINNFVF